MAFYSKIKWILGILLVFVLIFTTNLIDKSNFVRIKDSVVTLYQDRLIADEIIYEMSCLFHEKEIAVLTGDSLFYSRFNNKVNIGLKGFVTKFGKTRLIEEEDEVFEEFKTNFEELKVAETKYVQSGFMQKNEVIDELNSIKENLNILSKIQTDEGQRQWSISKSAMDTIELFTQMEVYLLAFLAIIIQIIILYKPAEQETE
jgi:hypothetical protein